jgi:hypothetical protein
MSACRVAFKPCTKYDSCTYIRRNSAKLHSSGNRRSNIVLMVHLKHRTNPESSKVTAKRDEEYQQYVQFLACLLEIDLCQYTRIYKSRGLRYSACSCRRMTCPLHDARPGRGPRLRSTDVSLGYLHLLPTVRPQRHSLTVSIPSARSLPLCYDPRWLPRPSSSSVAATTTPLAGYPLRLHHSHIR